MNKNNWQIISVHRKNGEHFYEGVYGMVNSMHDIEFGEGDVISASEYAIIYRGWTEQEVDTFMALSIAEQDNQVKSKKCDY